MDFSSVLDMFRALPELLSSMMRQVEATIVPFAGSPWVYVLVFACATIDGFFPPIPSESVVVSLAAVSMSGGAPSLIGLFAAAAVGAVLGDNIAYQLGRWIHPDDDHGPRWLRGERMQRAFAWARKALDRRGAMMILVARHIPVGRVAVNVMAGATHYPRRRFIMLTIIGGLLWAGYGIGIGVLAGFWVKDQPLLAAAAAVVVAIVLGVIVDRVLTLINKRRGIGTPDDPNLPADQGEGAPKEAELTSRQNR